jgi:maltose O-acetyltransferase
MKFVIAKYSFIHLGCRFNCKGNFAMDEYSTINQNCQIDNRGGISIGKRVSLSSDVKLITADHNLYQNDCIGRNRPITIEDYVFVGYGALILGNSKLSIGSAVGAMSVFKGLTEPYGVYLGNPAILKKKRPESLDYKMDYDRLFH